MTVQILESVRSLLGEAALDKIIDKRESETRTLYKAAMADLTSLHDRVVALAAMGSDLIDKPLAAAYFYRRYKSAVLFAHTLIAYALVTLVTLWRAPRGWVYGVAFVGHGVLDRIWHFHDTFYWPFRGRRFHVWGKRGS